MKYYMLFIWNSTLKQVLESNILKTSDNESLSIITKEDALFFYIKYDSLIYKTSFKVISKKKINKELDITLIKFKDYNKSLEFKKNTILFDEIIKKNILGKQLNNIILFELSKPDVSKIERNMGKI